ncbi:MAG: zinc-binding dehydrogenase [Rhodospirillales bacterium]|nr:zinc-binding dehydrogenase [Rhodospirillales bacterium]
MKAAVIEQRGAVGNIVYRDWPDPEIGPHEVLVQVKACAFNYLDLEVRRGMTGFLIETPWISSGGGAGVVEATGEEVTRARPGDHVVNTSGEDFSRAAWTLSEKKGVDICVNDIGGPTRVPALRAMTKNGRVVTCSASAGFDPQTDIRSIWTRKLRIIGTNDRTDDGITWLLEKIAAGRMKPVIDSVFPLSESQDARYKLEERWIFGKVVLTP